MPSGTLYYSLFIIHYSLFIKKQKAPLLQDSAYIKHTEVCTENRISKGNEAKQSICLNLEKQSGPSVGKPQASNLSPQVKRYTRPAESRKNTGSWACLN